MRPAGAALLATAYLIGSHLVRVGPLYRGHEPFSVYILSIVLFFCASAGAAMAVHGHHLFDHVVVSRRWMANPPPSVLTERLLQKTAEPEHPPYEAERPRHDPIP